MTHIPFNVHNSSHPTQPHSIIAIWPVGFTEKYRRWGLIKISLVCFGNAYCHMSFVSLFKGVNQRLINLQSISVFYVKYFPSEAFNCCN